MRFDLLVTEELPEAPEVALVEIVGKLGVSNARTLDSALVNLREHGFTRVVLDLSRAVYLNSGAASVLLRHQELLRAKGGGLALVALGANLPLVIDMLGLKDVLPAHETRAEAVERLARLTK